MNPKILFLDEIKAILNTANILPAIEKGFIAYSQDEAVIPPVGELLFEKPVGDVHIKYGYLKNDNYYVIKVASGFYENSKFNLPSSNGLMLLFEKKTGQLLCILLDKGFLTNVRTAAAGVIVARYLAPKHIHAIGIVGTGVQAQLQLSYLKYVTDCRDVIVWGRSEENLLQYKKALTAEGFAIKTTQKISDVTRNCHLIITTTPSQLPLINGQELQEGTHITAVGADTPNKRELNTDVFARANVIVADSILQCSERGEIAHAIKEKMITCDDIIELGHVLALKKSPRISEDQITVADLTGIAVQDIQIAKLVYGVD